jgi:aspartyl aminopeptidase
MQKNAAKVIEGENLDILVGSIPLDGAEKDAVKANVLKIVGKKYGIEEEDFLSAELEVVPAGRAREAGFDRSMIISYGQDDRVCAYTSLVAMLETKNMTRTACCLLVDKEEIGSVGATLDSSIQPIIHSTPQIFAISAILKKHISKIPLKKLPKNKSYK